MVKNLKSKIKETDARIAAFDRNTQKVQDLQTAKSRKLAEGKAAKGK